MNELIEVLEEIAGIRRIRLDRPIEGASLSDVLRGLALVDEVIEACDSALDALEAAYKGGEE